MSPRTCAGREVAAAGIPLGIRNSIVVRSSKVLDTHAPFFLGLAGAFAADFVLVEVKVPKLEFRLC